FDRFFRIENDTHTIKGTGLGLHLVKIAIEKHHHGQVFVQSKLGEGSTFGFRLPLNMPKVEIENVEPPLLEGVNLEIGHTDEHEDVAQENFEQQEYQETEEQEVASPFTSDNEWEISFGVEKRDV
ncbi:MAG: ATP-binding protein, partial [bacterium]